MSVVISLRVPKELKESLEELGVDWRKAVREYLEKMVREERRKRILARARDQEESREGGDRLCRADKGGQVCLARWWTRP